MIDWVYLEEGARAIAQDSTGPHLLGAYSALYAASIVPPDRDLAPKDLLAAIRRLSADLWDALTMIWRVEWQKEAARHGDLDEMRWMYFASADVRELHVSLRSFYDSLCFLIAPLAAKPDQVRARSFEQLRNWTLKAGNRERLGVDWAREIIAASWFTQLRLVRNGLVHEGWRPLVFPQLDRVGFQVHARALKGLRYDSIMLNEHIVDLEMYSTVQIGQAIGLLDRLCRVALARIGVGATQAQLRAYHPALGLLKGRISRLRKPVEAGHQ